MMSLVFRKFIRTKYDVTQVLFKFLMDRFGLEKLDWEIDQFYVDFY